jgi:hypothetical protein
MGAGTDDITELAPIAAAPRHLQAMELVSDTRESSAPIELTESDAAASS